MKFGEINSGRYLKNISKVVEKVVKVKNFDHSSTLFISVNLNELSGKLNDFQKMNDWFFSNEKTYLLNQMKTVLLQHNYSESYYDIIDNFFERIKSKFESNESLKYSHYTRDFNSGNFVSFYFKKSNSEIENFINENKHIEIFKEELRRLINKIEEVSLNQAPMQTKVYWIKNEYTNAPIFYLRLDFMADRLKFDFDIDKNLFIETEELLKDIKIGINKFNEIYLNAYRKRDFDDCSGSRGIYYYIRNLLFKHLNKNHSCLFVEDNNSCLEVKIPSYKEDHYEKHSIPGFGKISSERLVRISKESEALGIYSTFTKLIANSKSI